MTVKARIRLDFKAEDESAKFFWQRPNLKEAAKNIRAQNISLLKNLPFQGIDVSELSSNYEVYLLPGEGNSRQAAYAPVEMVVEADSLEDLMQLTLREEFRKIKVLEPQALQLSSTEMERFLFKVNEEYQNGLEEIN